MCKLLFQSLIAIVVLTGCGGGADSTVTTITGGGLQDLGKGPEVGYAFVEQINNMPVVVDGGPEGIFSLAQANVLYATVKVCEPGTNNCQTIDHVQVDTGSVGLRVLASKVRQLNLPSVELAGGGVTGKPTLSHECYPFVIGGLWGPNKVADVGLGKQVASAIPIQLIQDDPSVALQVPQDCSDAVSGAVLNSASTLGSNGILGIGSVKLDCGQLCTLGEYTNSYVQYYGCPSDVTRIQDCRPAAVPSNFQVFNPVAALPEHNNGVVLVLPQVTGLGAFKVHGELIFGINSLFNNQLAATANRINLGVDWKNNFASYLNVTTTFKDKVVANSYLDTGTNALFFADTGIANCVGSSWFCPADLLHLAAVISNGDNPQLNRTVINFDIGNADALFSTTNTAFQILGGTHVSGGAPSQSFAWGLPFFYGRRTYLSIWQQAGAESGPWYSF
jgi:hypothetical protein